LVSTMPDEELEKAIALIKAGNIDQGGKILVSLLKQNQQIERAWAWLYVYVKTDDQRIYCLKKVLELNPNHEKAKTALARLTKQQTFQLEPSPSAQENKLIAPKDTAEPTAKQKRRRKPKPKPEIQESEPTVEKSTKSAEPHVFKIENYKVVFTKPGENLFAKDKRTPNDFPEIDSGMYYGTKLVIGGVSITSFDYPNCVEEGRTLHKSQCYFCEFFSVSDCPIRRDPTILRDVIALYSQNRSYWQEYQERRDEIIDAIYSELKAHGRPLHYEILTKIVCDRYPKLKLNSRKIVHIMGWHTGKFECIGEGVYKAK